ncbi:MAG: hypothetical protein AAGK02_03730 [Pseudomonadota bacterium]
METSISGRTHGRRWKWYAAAFVIGVLALAWFDGGEEPLHPITHNVPVPGAG